MSSTESPSATLATRAVAMSSWILSQPMRPSTSATDKSVGMMARNARITLRNARVSISRMPPADQRKVPHCVAMIASVVRVIRNERPVKYELGPNFSTAAAVASRKIRDLSGAGICSFMRIKMRVCSASVFQKLLQQLFLRRGRDQVELVGEQALLSISGQCRQSSVRVEHRGQREHLGDRVGVG